VGGRCPVELEEEFIEDCKRYPNSYLVEKYDRAISTITEWKKTLFAEGRLNCWPGNRLCAAPPEEEALIIEAEAAMVCGDVEVPYHDGELLGYMVALARRLGHLRLPHR